MQIAPGSCCQQAFKRFGDALHPWEKVLTSEYPSTTRMASIERFLEKIREVGVPEKVDRQYLKQIGFKGGTNTYLIGIMKGLDFIDKDGTPTTRWKEYRDASKSKKVMAEAIKAAYRDLYATYPDAHKRTEETLINWLCRDEREMDEQGPGQHQTNLPSGGTGHDRPRNRTQEAKEMTKTTVGEVVSHHNPSGEGSCGQAGWSRKVF